MGIASVIKMSREEALLERSRLLKNVGMSIEDLRTRAAEYTLNDAEFIIWQRIEDLNWLLGEPDPLFRTPELRR